MYRCRKQTNKQTKVPVCRDFDIQCPQRTARKVNSEANARMVQRHAYWKASACDFSSPCLSQLYGLELEVYFLKIDESKYVIRLFFFLPQTKEGKIVDGLL